MGGFQFGVGGDIFYVEALLDSFIPIPMFKDWYVRFQQRPANILIRTWPRRCGSAWGPWSRCGRLTSSTRRVRACRILRILEEIEDEPDAAAFRWAIVINNDMGIGLRLQTLPTASTVLCGKPMMRK
jgi:hypothetical protein